MKMTDTNKTIMTSRQHLDDNQSLDEEQGIIEIVSPAGVKEEFQPTSQDTSSQVWSDRHHPTNSMRYHRVGNTTVKLGSRSTMVRSLLHQSSSVGNEDESGRTEKLRILALHGKASNGEVTKLQLSNLGVTEDNYDIVYLNGPIVEEDGDPEITEFVVGPFYSWFYGNYSDARYTPSFLCALIHVITAIQKLGPFNAVYGFSQGATVAAFTALSFTDIELRNTLIAFDKCNAADLTSGDASLKKNSMIAKNEISQDFFDEEPFDYMLLACPVEDPDVVKDALGLNGSVDASSVSIPSMHLIGVSDPRKMYTEKMVAIFSDAQVKYMVGGHGVTRLVASDKDLLYTLQKCLRERQNVVEMEAPLMKSISGITSMGLMSSIQVAHVELDLRKVEDTLVKALLQKDRNKALLYNARETIGSNYTSYGDVLDFIDAGGAGDLRRLNVKDGEVVAYGAPPGGGAASALAFLSIMAQTAAAPLAPDSQESDAVYFLEQVNAKHLILFEGFESPGLEAAFERYAATGKAVLHRATIRDGGKPGMFDYTQTGERKLDENWVPSLSGLNLLQNPASGIGLLLGTSGTTSKPKVVPILQSSLVQNGYIIASTLGLFESDTCYSIMPLFHIGGISASILCSITAGCSICCDNQAYNPETMIDALAISNPRPTWYSAVPTIHNATVSHIRYMANNSEKLKSYGVQEDGTWTNGHSLRMIRSGAAALLQTDAINLSTTYGGIPVIPTYSMSEQMPISQPPVGKIDMLTDKPGSVGVPVATSLAVVDSSTLKPLPFGEAGEIAISGQTVISNYSNNQDADRKAFFELTLPLHRSCVAARGRFFLTGDVGALDKEGFLTLRGRNKELIKKGGEQISPFAIEEILLLHPWIEITLCFAVPSQIYGEETGAAMVLSPNAPTGVTTDEVVKEMRGLLQKNDVSPFKWPTKWKIVQSDDLPKTKTKKYIRVGLSEHLNLEGILEGTTVEKEQLNNTFIDWDVIAGFRFLLACYVMFMHIGSKRSWSAFDNLRGWPWHLHVFFTLGGFSLAAPMNPVIEKKFKYFMARIGAMYPMYAVALLFLFANLLVSCRPSTFRPDFHWDAQPDDLYIDGDESKGLAPLFCEGTPATPTSYWASLFLTIFVYITGSLVTPFFLTSWWMGYYLWFSSMYYQCLMVFPVVYNALAKWRSNVRMYLSTLAALFALNVFLLLLTWLVSKDYKGYNHYDEVTGLKNDPDSYEDAHKHNATILAWYLFSPFWILYFVIGAVTAFLYDAYRPAEKNNSRVWGYIADGCTLIVVIWSICLVAQGKNRYNFESDFTLRPEEANNFTDTAQINRLWDNICGRLVAPLTTLWLFALSTGEGWTAMVLRSTYLVDCIAPHAYNCFLFHQPIGQWYFAATRNGQWWNWWRYRKIMYWFSPSALPVEWYEYFAVVTLTVGFSALMNATAMPLISNLFNLISEFVSGKSSDEEINIEDALIVAIENMSGFSPKLHWTLDQCGLSSVGLPQLAQRLQKALSTTKSPISVGAAALSSAKTVGDIVNVLGDIKRVADTNHTSCSLDF